MKGNWGISIGCSLWEGPEDPWEGLGCQQGGLGGNSVFLGYQWRTSGCQLGHLRCQHCVLPQAPQGPSGWAPCGPAVPGCTGMPCTAPLMAMSWSMGSLGNPSR